MKNVSLFNASRTPLSFSNICFGDAENIRLELEKAKTTEDFVKIASDKTYYTWQVVKDDPDMVQLRAKDSFDNAYYISAFKDQQHFSKKKIEKCISILQYAGVENAETVLDDIVQELTGYGLYDEL